METLEHLAQALDSVDDLQSIVRTMKTLSAASIRQYERAVQAIGEYHRTVELGLQVVLRDAPEVPLTRRPHDAPLGVVVVGSDHGLCGRFNEDLAEFAARSLAKPAAAGRLRTLVIGERMAALLGQARLPVETVLPTAGSAARIPDTVDRVLLGIDEWHSTRHIDVVHLLYSRRRTGERSVPAAQRILPVDLRHLRRPAAPPWPSHVLPTYRMPRDELLAALVRQYLFVALCRGCAESHAAEHASRLSAMERAEHNLDERRASLVTRFRRQRQSVITAELLDVVGGYEALQTEGEPR